MKLARALMMLFTVMVLTGPFLAKANYIHYAETVYSTDYLSTGVGGMRNYGYGTITLTNLTGTVRKAYLYWHGPTVLEATNPAVNAVVKVNGQTVVGSNIGMASDNCWLSQGYNYLISHAYRADITSIVASNRNGNYLLTEFMKPFGTNTIGININGASMLVFYDDGNPSNNRDVVLFEGNDSNATSPFPTNSPAYDDIGWNVKLSGINYTSGPVSLQLHISDGQYFEPKDDGPITLNVTNLLEGDGHNFSGNSVPSANNGPANNGALWDIRTYSVNQYLTKGVNTISVSNKFVLADCISLVTAVVNLPAGAAPRTNAPPTIACQAPLTLPSTNVAVVSAQVTYSGVSAPTYKIELDGTMVRTGTLPASTNTVTTTLSLTNGFGFGVHTVTFTLTDTIGTAVCSSAVIVPPNINCSPDLTVPTDVSKTNAVVTFQVTSSAAGAIITCVPPSGSTFPLGTNTVNCTANDIAGNSATCSFKVRVMDIEVPTVRCPQPVIVSTEPGTNSAVVNFQVAASDNVPGVTVTCLPPSGSRFALGSNTVVCTALDVAGNTGSCSFTVTVKDNENPKFVNCPTNIVQKTDAGKSNAVVTWTISASDNIPGVTVTCTPPSGSVFNTGTNPVHCVATDLAGNSATCGFSVTVFDNEPPQVTCPTNLVRSTDANTCASSNVIYSLTVVDNVPSGITSVCNPPSGSTFAKGTNLVSCTATDAAGNVATCSFQVIVNDTQPPTLTLPNIAQSTDSNSCSAVVTFTPVATDVCSGQTLVVCNPPSGSTFNKGTNSVTCRATDASGNSITNTFTVTVADKDAPVISCPATIVQATEKGRTDAIVTFAPTATDNCGTASVTTVPASGSRFPIGTNQVTATATDASGNQSICTFLVVVVDQEPPLITCPGTIYRTADNNTCATSNVTWTAIVTDNVTNGIGYTCIPAPGSTFATGTNLVTCTAHDAAGNRSSCSFAVVVNDRQAPVLTVPATIVQNTDNGLCTAAVTFTPTALDACSGDVQIRCVPPSGSSFGKGTNSVLCFATDASNNTSTNAFKVVVVDKELPVITCPATIVQIADTNRTDAVVTFNVSATDTCGTATVVSVPASGSRFPLGTNIVTSVATDSSGNKSTCTFLVVVIDREPPQIVCPPAIVRNTDKNTCEASNVTWTASVTDNVTNGISYTCIPASGSTFPKGTNVVTCTALDAAGNRSSCSFSVVINDRQAPTLNVPTNITRNTDASSCTAVVSFTTTASDACSDNVLVVCNPQSGASFNKGVTPVRCTATDASGNSVTNSFTVTVEDKELPVITCPADIRVTSDAGKSTALVNFTVNAVDSCGTATVVSIPPSGSVFPMGTNTVISTATDASGNKSSCTFLVVVGDSEPPKITCPASDITATNTPGLCSAPVVFNVTATDNMHTVGVVCQPASGSVFPVGTNLVTCVATDQTGNTNACSFRVIVRDTEKPSLVLVGATSITVECHTSFSDPGVTAIDNCGGNLNASVKLSGNVDVNTPGTYTRTYTVADVSGNTASATRTIRVVDTQAPLITLIGANPYKVACGQKYEEPGATALDACGGDLSAVIQITGSVDAASPGTYTITYTVADASGNTNTATRAVQVSTGTLESTELYPIALSKQSLENVKVGDIIPNILNGTGSGNFGWLSWNGRGDAPTLAASLTPPGDSANYVNPLDSKDHVVTVGDWVSGNTGVSGSAAVRSALDTLTKMDIIVPVWDKVSSTETANGTDAQLGQGGKVYYHVVNFARVRLTSYKFGGANYISARFLGLLSCGCDEKDVMTMTLNTDFNNTSIRAGNFIWFNSVLRVSGIGSEPVTIHLVNQNISGPAFNLAVSNATVIIDPAAATATTEFIKGEWVTRVPLSMATNNYMFLSGLAYKVPALIGQQKGVSWSGTFISDSPDVTISWRWAAAVYSIFGADYTADGIIPVDNAKTHVQAGTPAKYKNYLVAGASGNGNGDYTGSYSGVASASACSANGQPLHVPRLTNVRSTEDHKYSVTWASKPGKSYKVQYKDSLYDPAWKDLPGTVSAVNSTSQCIDGTVNQGQQRFYRVVVLP